MAKAQAEKWPRLQLPRRLARIKGMYVPRFFEFDFEHGGPITAIRPHAGRLPSRSASCARPRRGAVSAPSRSSPNVAIVHDRVGVEVQRGCTKGCRFCQAGMIFRPTRQRNPEKVLKIVDESLAADRPG